MFHALFILLLLCGCRASNIGTYVAEEEYVVISVVIVENSSLLELPAILRIAQDGTNFTFEHPPQERAKLIVMTERTRFGPLCFPTQIFTNTTKVDAAYLWKELVERNRTASILMPKFSTPGRQCVLFCTETAPQDYGSKEEFWDEFFHKYPGSQGIASVSRVAFNRDGDVALVYVENQRGPLEGQGMLILLARKSEGWYIQARELVVCE